VQATDEAAEEPDSAATDTAVHPITAAINTENSRFSEIRLKALIFVSCSERGDPFSKAPM
jgi:hypothetical protein